MLGIARLGYALTGRPIGSSEAVDELWAADEDGNNIMSSSEFLNYSADKFINDVDPNDWNQVHHVLGTVAQRIRRNTNTCLAPHDNLLLARQNREEIDCMCADLIASETSMEEVLAEVQQTYRLDQCKNEKEKRILKMDLAFECAKYKINWGSGDSKSWDYDYGYQLFNMLATLKVMELNGKLTL